MRASRSLSIRPKSRPSWLLPRDSTNILLAGRRQRPHLEGIQRLEEDSASNGSLRCEVARGGSFGRTSHLLDSERQGHRDYGQHRGGEERETESRTTAAAEADKSAPIGAGSTAPTTVSKTARPKGKPTRCEVLMSPEARPSSPGWVPASAAMLSAGRPMLAPRDQSRMPGSIPR